MYSSEREEEDALEQARQAHMATERAREQQSDVDKQKAKREKERLKEQEKRRRLAVSTVLFNCFRNVDRLSLTLGAHLCRLSMNKAG